MTTYRGAINPTAGSPVTYNVNEWFIGKAEAVAETPENGKMYFVGGTDGGMFKGVTGAAAGTYSDNGGSYCGTQFIPTGGDGSAAWVRVDGGYNVGLFYAAEWFGITGSGTETTEMQNGINAAVSAGYDFIGLSTSITVADLEKLDQIRIVSVTNPVSITVGSDVFNVPYQNTTSGTVTLYVDPTGSDSLNCGIDSTVPFKTWQQAIKTLPKDVAHDVVIIGADGTYSEQGGEDEFGRPVILDLSTLNVNPLRDTSIALNTKAAKITLRGTSEAGTILDGTTIGARYSIWAHGIKDIELESMTLTGSYGGIISHQGSDVTMYDVTTSGNTYGRMIESDSRMEVIRGTNTSNSISGYFIKNGHLQENDSTLTGNTLNEMRIYGSSYVYMLRVDGAAASGKNYIDAEGVGKIEFEDCDISGGNHFITGSCIECRIANGTRLHGFTSSACNLQAGYFVSDKGGSVNHIYDNTFVAYITDGSPTVDIENCDSTAYASTHDGANNVAVLTDSTQAWVTDEFIGFTLNNTTDGSTTTVTANTATTITGVLSGGTDNDWDTSDSYTLVKANTNGIRLLGDSCSAVLDPLCTVTSADKILTRPTSGLVFKGNSPPTDSTVFYERGAICYNESASVGTIPYWIVTTKGYGGSVVWTAHGVVTATTTELEDITDAINTADKVITKLVVNTTTEKVVRAVGTTAGSVWADMAGITTHTPV